MSKLTRCAELARPNPDYSQTLGSTHPPSGLSVNPVLSALECPDMVKSNRQHGFARRSLWVSVALAIGAFVFFVVRDEPVTGVLIAFLLAGAGYFEYQRRQRDKEMISGRGKDPQERDRSR